MDSVSHLIRLARIEARLDKRCRLAGSTNMDVTYDEQAAPFHVLLEGTCTLQVGPQLLHLQAGDVVLLTNSVPHRITTPGLRPLQGVTETAGDAFVTTRSMGSGAAIIDLFCGHYTFGAGAGAMLLRSLPDAVHVSFGRSTEGGDVLRTLSGLMRGEAQREGEGTAAILSALCTVLLAMVLRTSKGVHTDSTLWTAAGAGRLADLLAQVLNDPAGDWSIERLSRKAAMSRATFIRHFSRSTGMTVGEFVGRARLMAASELLATTDATVASVASQVGYRSESAFTRSFRLALGTTPARFRRTSAARPDSAQAPGATL